MLTLLICMMHLGAPREIPELAPLRLDVEATEKYLIEQPELLRHHLGYLQYLEAHPDLAALEQDWWEINRLARFAPLSEDFDNALAADDQAAQLFDSFYANLAGSGGTDWAERVKQLGGDAGFGQETLRAALEYLTAHPELLLPLLRNDYAGAAVPDVMTPLREYVRNNPEALQTLHSLLSTFLSGNPKAQDLLQFWSPQAAGAASGVRAYTSLVDYFKLHPAHFWLWHNRNLALADDPHTAAWFRWWQQRVRRDATLRDTYFPYLAHVGRQHGMLGLLERTGSQVLPETWPGPGAPPPLPDTPSTPEMKMPAVPRMLDRPDRPRIQKPVMPMRPDRPERPSIQMRPPRPARERR